MKSILQKGVYYLKNGGFCHTLKLVLIFIWDKIRIIYFYLIALFLFAMQKKRIIEKVEGKNVIVFTPSVEWNFLYQRAQQMATSYAQSENNIVIFLTTQRHYDNYYGIKEIKPHLFLVNKGLASFIDSITSQAKQVISCVYTVTLMEPLFLYRSDKLIYEYIDDLHFFFSKACDYSVFEKRHQDLLKQADIVVATATKLYDEIAPFAKKPILLPNAADYDFFSQTNVEANKEMKEKVNGYSCVLGYYGTLSDWFDYDVVYKTAIDHPDWAWILIGQEVTQAMEKSRVKELNNIFYIPPIPYERLPEYIACMDILTIPFVINQTTLATSPVKLFEYMASGKPIITSDMPECRKYKSVNIYHSKEEFERFVVTLLNADNAEYYQLLEKEAKENTWKARTDAIMRELNIM